MVPGIPAIQVARVYNRAIAPKDAQSHIPSYPDPGSMPDQVDTP